MGKRQDTALVRVYDHCGCMGHKLCTWWCLIAVRCRAEIPPLFGTWRLYYNSTDNEIRLGEDMRSYWTNFARGNLTSTRGLPGARSDSPVWEVYSASQDNWMRLQINQDLGMVNKPYPECDFWDSLDSYGKY
jgi:hypothetical protein